MTALIAGLDGGRILGTLLEVALAASLWAGISLPLAAAHLEFWSGRRGRPEDREAAARLGEVAVANLGVLAAAAAGTMLLALVRKPDRLLPLLIWLAPVLPWAWLAGTAYAALVLLYASDWGWRGRPPAARTACGAAAGLLALLLAAVRESAEAAASAPALWPLVAENPWVIFRQPGAALFTLHHALGAGAAGGVALMLAGRGAFRWESSVPLSAGARLIRWGAACVLASSALQILLGAAWVGSKGPAWVRATFYGGGRPLLIGVALLVASAIFLLEVAVSALRRKGSAPRAGLAAAALLAAVALTAGWVRAGVEGASRPGPPKTVRAETGGRAAR